MNRGVEEQGQESEDPALSQQGVAPELSAGQNVDPLRIDELTDRLIEKREKLQYFIITAATAVTVFTFNDFNKPLGLLRSGPAWLPLLGWLLLTTSSGLSLYVLRKRHDISWLNLSMRYDGAVSPLMRGASTIAMTLS
jgi:hypothetical protein